MRYRSLSVFGLFLIFLFALGCGQKNDVIPQQVSQRLSELQQRMNIVRKSDTSPTTNLSLSDDVPAWQKFPIKARDIFKPLETNELSEDRMIVDAYHVQLKGLVGINRQTKAIISVNDRLYMVENGQIVTGDIILQGIHDDGVDLQRSYKKIYLTVGEKADI